LARGGTFIINVYCAGMDFLQAIILSIIEGITEFLPVSSTGHLILASNFLKIPQTEFLKSFEIFIQLGAILAVLTLYYKHFLKDCKMFTKVLVAFLPTAVLGLVFYKVVKQFLLGNMMVTIVALFIGGVLFIIFERFYKEERHSKIYEIKHITFAKALWMGLFQSIAMIPGVSRSAATIFGGMTLGLDRKTSVEFSFLLAIPTMIAATSFDIYKSSFAFAAEEYWLLAAGFIGAFITALLAVKFFLKYIEKNTFTWFGIYRIAIAAIFWILIVM